jgi:ribonuclease HII
VSCASIVAKVTRDRLMAKLALRYPGYGWEHNAGYATSDHRAGMAALGVTPHHRRSFITTKRILEGEQTSFDLFGEETSDVGPVAVPVEVVSDALIEVPVPA